MSLSIYVLSLVNPALNTGFKNEGKSPVRRRGIWAGQGTEEVSSLPFLCISLSPPSSAPAVCQPLSVPWSMGHQG